MKEFQQIYYLSRIFHIPNGCKSDFERACGVPEKYKIFRNWLNELIEEGVLEFDGYRKNPHKIIIYKPNKKMILKKIRSMNIYIHYKNLFFYDYESF